MSIVAQGVIRKPLSYQDALRSSESHLWKEVIDDEVKSLENNLTWDLVDASKNHKISRGKWVYKLKYKIDGKISSYKTRWVAKDFEQRESINFEETFSPVVKSCTTQILLALAAFYGWSVEQMNAVTAYLNSEIDVVLYIEAPTGDKTLCKVYLLRKTVYGLQQSARQWSKDLAQNMIGAGLKRLVSDYFAFAKNLGTSKLVIVIVYVYDFLFFGPDISEINTVKKYLADRYKIKDLGPCGQFTEIKLIRILTKKQSIYSRSYISTKHLTLLVFRIANLFSLQ